MLKQEQHGEITVIITGRKMGNGFLFPVYSYLVDGLLIDTGAPVARKDFNSFLANVNISTVVNTHAHEDHIGNNRDVVEMKHARLFAHANGLPILANPRSLRLKFYQRFAWGMPLASTGEPIPAKLLTKFHIFNVIETPGHSPSHVCLHEAEQGWLFSGDLHAGTTELIFQPRDDFHEILASLKKLQPLEFHEIYCAHQGVISNAHERLEDKFNYMMDVESKVEQLHGQEIPLKEISRRVLGKENAIAMITGGDLSKLNVIKSILRRDAGTFK